VELTRSGGHPEYKAEVVELIRSTSKTVGQVARELDLTETAVRQWVRQAELDAGRRTDGLRPVGSRRVGAGADRRVVATLRKGRDDARMSRARPISTTARWRCVAPPTTAAPEGRHAGESNAGANRLLAGVRTWASGLEGHWSPWP
jgi:transposase-like protein